ncbi:rhodanese-like domain-containing protein [Sphingomonas sp.]|uniref:rhodanese-like domain-containing protein n=1 Tax=Sphingomonas sp. TaxID=28214 RepID=UPI003D6D6846
MRKALILLTVLAGLSVAMPLSAKEAPPPANPLIDYDGFVALTQDVGPYRAKRLLNVADFKRESVAPNALLLDARSAEAFRQGHIAGAVNLPLPDFTAESLARVIGSDTNRPIYIYCNNNFRNNIAPVVTKSRPLALNIQTFVNLVGYGYKQVWELGEAIDMNDPAIGWVRGQPTQG